ncbi:putative U3 small nucleolar RNA-associated protein 11 isoform X2 [Brevipalpus obovatus]
MASLAKSNKAFQRLHRERHQPEARKKFGFLEKKKDYKKRALDYQKKQKTLKTLREKVANKNPDEFHFHMLNSQLIEGRHFEKRKDSDDVKAIEAHNRKYLHWRRSIDLKKIEKLQSGLHFIDVEGKPKNNHIFFCDRPKEKMNEVKQALNMAPQLGGRIANIPDPETLRKEAPLHISKKQIKRIGKEKEKSYKILLKRIDREKKLKSLIDKKDFTLKPKKKKKDPFDDD